MEKFRITQHYSFEEKCYHWMVYRADGKSFRDGVSSYNFPYNEKGALDAIECAKKLEKEFSE
jgi:tRNA(His) 5'-end guanylyltransferase